MAEDRGKAHLVLLLDDHLSRECYTSQKEKALARFGNVYLVVCFEN